MPRRKYLFCFYSKFPVSAELPGPLTDHYQLHFTIQQISFLSQNLQNVDTDYFSTVPNKSTSTAYFQHILMRTEITPLLIKTSHLTASD